MRPLSDFWVASLHSFPDCHIQFLLICGGPDLLSGIADALLLVPLFDGECFEPLSYNGLDFFDLVWRLRQVQQFFVLLLEILAKRFFSIKQDSLCLFLKQQVLEVAANIRSLFQGIRVLPRLQQ